MGLFADVEKNEQPSELVVRHAMTKLLQRLAIVYIVGIMALSLTILQSLLLRADQVIQ